MSWYKCLSLVIVHTGNTYVVVILQSNFYHVIAVGQASEI